MQRNPVNSDGTVTGGRARGVCFIDPHPALTAAIRHRNSAPADQYTAVAETTDHGCPIRDHLARFLHDGEIIWAPALEGALLVSTRGGDYELHLGKDLSIGYLSHDAERVELYLQESLTFLALTAESSVVLIS
ncbi:family 1 encapsulin nanocompartment shell protein [Kribbella qitaiheensis]|uniref:family 1 encapsulin nanocompartment shell protein n=1 Tax=Kribbella qitaiheensis TaxID=1544730 RepID=UPI00361D4A08